jgi:hypothetical protein
MRPRLNGRKEFSAPIPIAGKREHVSLGPHTSARRICNSRRWLLGFEVHGASPCGRDIYGDALGSGVAYPVWLCLKQDQELEHNHQSFVIGATAVIGGITAI